MNTYETIDVVTLRAGNLKLDKDQLRRRRHLLAPTGERGIYKIEKPVQFKVGEVFGFDGDIDRLLESKLIDSETGAKISDQRRREENKPAGSKGSVITGFFANLFGKKSDAELAEDELRFTELVEAIGKIDQGNPAFWTKDKGPVLKTLREVAQRDDLTEDQRDAAWEAYLAKQEFEAKQAE